MARMGGSVNWNYEFGPTMTPSEIITADAQQHQVDPQRVLNFVANHIAEKRGNLLQHGETVLLLIHLGQQAAECHLYTIDNPMAIRTALQSFLHTIQQTPVKRLYGKADNPGILQMLHLIGLNVEHSDLPQYNWMANI